MKIWMTLMLAVLGLSGCAGNVPASRQQQVDQINQTGIYSYERAMDGPPR